MLKYSTYQSIYNKPSANSYRVERSEHSSRLIVNRLIKVFVLVVLLTATCTGVVSAFASSDRTVDPAQLESVVVMPGDTLWEIALAHKPDSRDTRSYIKEIKDVNGMSVSSIQAGEVLLLPSE